MPWTPDLNFFGGVLLAGEFIHTHTHAHTQVSFLLATNSENFSKFFIRVYACHFAASNYNKNSF